MLSITEALSGKLEAVSAEVGMLVWAYCLKLIAYC
jgi:hypothetical protein